VYTKVNSKFIQSPRVSVKPLKITENTGQKVDNIEYGNDFLDTTPKGDSKTKTDKYENTDLEMCTTAYSE
jgi:hypothetical protein